MKVLLYIKNMSEKKNDPIKDIEKVWKFANLSERVIQGKALQITTENMEEPYVNLLFHLISEYPKGPKGLIITGSDLENNKFASLNVFLGNTDTLHSLELNEVTIPESDLDSDSYLDSDSDSKECEENSFSEFCDALAKNISLQNIKIINCSINEGQMSLLVDSFSKMKNLESLDLSDHNDFNDYEYLEEIKSKTIKQLVINNCNIANKELVKLIIIHNPKLEILSVANNGLKKNDIIEIKQYIEAKKLKIELITELPQISNILGNKEEPKPKLRNINETEKAVSTGANMVLTTTYSYNLPYVYKRNDDENFHKDFGNVPFFKENKVLDKKSPIFFQTNVKKIVTLLLNNGDVNKIINKLNEIGFKYEDNLNDDLKSLKQFLQNDDKEKKLLPTSDSLIAKLCNLSDEIYEKVFKGKINAEHFERIGPEAAFQDFLTRYEKQKKLETPSYIVKKGEKEENITIKQTEEKGKQI